jgi:hypothetical protein
VTILAQPKGVGFAAFLLTQVSFPSANRVRLDLAETEDHRRSYIVPRNPVETLTAQNKIRNPDVLTITGMLSANPLVAPLATVAVARLDKRELAKLRTLIDRDELLFIVTPERYVPNVICVSFNERYDDGTGNGVKLAMQFQEIQIAAPGLVAGVTDLDTLGISAGSVADQGPQTPATVADPGGLG